MQRILKKKQQTKKNHNSLILQVYVLLIFSYEWLMPSFENICVENK